MNTGSNELRHSSDLIFAEDTTASIISEVFPEVIQGELDRNNEPSCSAAEAFEC